LGKDDWDIVRSEQSLPGRFGKAFYKHFITDVQEEKRQIQFTGEFPSPKISGNDGRAEYYKL
jgi:hypothetical protein